MKRNFFERHSKLTITLVLIVCFTFILGMTEILCASVMGLGKTVVYMAHPVYGYRPQPNQIVARNTQHVVKINNLGLRAEQNWEQKDFQHKILFLGDSVTYGGSYISNPELFSHLAVNHPKYITGNAGVNAWGVNNVYALIKEMEFLPAQIFVSTFPEGDFYRGLMRIGGQPFWTQKPSSGLAELFQYLIYKMNLLKTPPEGFNQLSPTEKKHVAELAVRNLKSMDDYLKENHREHIIYITPSRSQALGLASEDKILKSLFSKYNLKVIYIKDKLNTIVENDIAELYHDEIHLSKKGHEIWARLMAPDLQELIKLHDKESYLAYAH